MKAGVNVIQDAVGELGNRPIHLAAAAGHTAVVKLLLRQGANVVSHSCPTPYRSLMPGTNIVLCAVQKFCWFTGHCPQLQPLR